jgi:hypothetical protein
VIDWTQHAAVIGCKIGVPKKEPRPHVKVLPPKHCAERLKIIRDEDKMKSAEARQDLQRKQEGEGKLKPVNIFSHRATKTQ